MWEIKSARGVYRVWYAKDKELYTEPQPFGLVRVQGEDAGDETGVGETYIMNREEMKNIYSGKETVTHAKRQQPKQRRKKNDVR